MRFDRPIYLTLVTGLLLAAPLAGAQDKAKKLYCWNEGGRKICGDALPASAVNNARTEINAKSGLAARRIERAMTDAERLAAKQAERGAEIEQARARRDVAMVESYGTEADLRRAFNARITLLDETVKASALGISGMRQSLVSLLRQAGDAELSGKPVPKPLSNNIRTQHVQLVRQQTLLQRQRAERATIDVELDAALKRYRELKSPSSQVATMGNPDNG